MKYWIITAALVLSLCVHAQLPSNRIKPGVMYHAGDTVRSPRIGLTTRIPAGWSGVLPREEEVFLLAPENGSIGEIYVMVNEKTNLQTQRQRWEKGMNLADGLRLESTGEITPRGTEVIGTMGKMVGNNANQQFKIYLEAKCSPAGFCVSYVATADPASFENVKSALQAFVDNTVFTTPSNESPYTNFDWKVFLSGKVLLGIGYEGKSKREDEVSLCADGTFRSNITRTGIFKGQAKEYQGKKKGKWDVTSVKEKATITFTFEKLPPVEIGIEAKDEEIYVRGQRYFVGESEECK
ncbi:MAG TPA: hypothetical protein VK666_12945 [Chryseolinea sp.]|nr:hypothetical protein [Chryseolinea sp.]